MHSLVAVFILAWESNFFTLSGFLLSPVVSTLGTNEDQVHPVLGRVHESHSLSVTTFLAADVLATWESWILHTLLVNLEEEFRSLATSCTGSIGSLRWVTWAIDTVISLILRFGLLKVSTNPAIVDESSKRGHIISLLFLGLEHVITLLTEAHTSESCHPKC